MKKNDDGNITRYIYDGNNLLLETDASGYVEAEFTYIPAEYAQVVSQNRDGDSSYYHFDGINNVRQLTDVSQVVTDEYDFSGWGERRSSTGSTANSQQYKGRLLAYRRDPDLGPDEQYVMHHRNYDPKTATFTSADPAEDDSNLYRYVRNNPVNKDDPSGLEDRLKGGTGDRYVGENPILLSELHVTQGMPYTIASVESRELNSRYLQGEVSYKTWRDASEQLMFSSRVRVPIGPTLGDGLSHERMNDKVTRAFGAAEAVAGAGEMFLGGALIETPFMPLGLAIFAHGSDHVHAGVGTFGSGID